MDKSKILADIVQRKTDRQTLLKEKSKQLEALDVDLTASKFVRFFGTSYFFIKRIILSILGIASLLLGLFLLFFPDLIITYYLESPPEKTIYLEILLPAVQLSAGLLILLGFVLLYISRITRKLHRRNTHISKAESLTQNIIKSFREMIAEEEKELAQLRNMINDETND